MGLIEGLFKQAVQNSTKCATWPDIKASHTRKKPNIALQFEDISGMLILLLIGISSAIFAFITEKVISMNARSPRDGIRSQA